MRAKTRISWGEGREFVHTVLAYSLSALYIPFCGCSLFISSWWTLRWFPLFVHTEEAALNILCRFDDLFVGEKHFRWETVCSCWMVPSWTLEKEQHGAYFLNCPYEVRSYTVTVWMQCCGPLMARASGLFFGSRPQILSLWGWEKMYKEKRKESLFFSLKPWKEVGLSLYPSSPQKGMHLQLHGGEGGEEIILTKKEKAEGRKDQEITTEILLEGARVGSQRVVFGMWILPKGQLEPRQELSSALG